MPMYEYQDIYDWAKQNHQRKRNEIGIEFLPEPQAYNFNQPVKQKKRRKFSFRRKKFYPKRYGLYGPRNVHFNEQYKMSKGYSVVNHRDVSGERNEKAYKKSNRHNRPRLRLRDYKRLTTPSPEIESIKSNINKIIAPMSPNTVSTELNSLLDQQNGAKTDSPEIESIKFNINKMISPLSPKIDVVKKDRTIISTTSMKTIQENEDNDMIFYLKKNENMKNVVSDNKNIDQNNRAKNHKMPNVQEFSSIEMKTTKTKFERHNSGKESKIEFKMKRMNDDVKFKLPRPKPENHHTRHRFKIRRKRPHKTNHIFGM